ncbi:phosphotransferase [Terrabacter sp. 2RAF25]|uniref:phosphotransferase n=1 Tax=Terrabacter sp. 2RAF25 TaxID=3232998 RepID=UPI003F9A3AFF
MGDRTILGTADVTDDELLAHAATALGIDGALCRLAGSQAEVVDYDLDAITTGGRWWVTADLATPDGPASVRFFVKLVQSWSRSPFFASVPPEFRATAERGVPWRTEPLVYASDLADRLPSGLTMAATVDIRPVDDLSTVIWLREVDVVGSDWPVDELARAARRLGRLAASPRVRPLSAIGEADGRRGVRSYAEGRLPAQVAPMLRSDEVWRHPVLTATFGTSVRERLLTHLDRVDEYVEWLETVPEGTAHGDACTNNLLVQAGSDELVLIDFGFWSTQPLGFDLGQLLLGDVQIGRRAAATLDEVEQACLPAYVDGLRDEGCDLHLDAVRRAHALQMLIFSGFSSFMLEGLLDPSSGGRGTGGPGPDAALLEQAAERARITEFVLDLVDETETHPQTATPAGRTASVTPRPA